MSFVVVKVPVALQSSIQLFALYSIS